MKITLNLAVRHLCVMLSVLFLFACSEKKPAKVTVNIKNGNDEQIIVSKPIRDQYFYFNQDTIRLGKDTVAVCQIEIDKIGIARIFVGDQECKLILQPGDDLEVTFDASNPKGDLLFTGTNAAGQMHYNGISRLWDMYAYEFKRDFTVAPLDTAGERMFQNFQNLADRDKAIFLKLKDDNLIDPAFQEFAEQDVQCFYMAQLSRILSGTYINYYFNDGPLYKNGEALTDLICQAFPITENTPRYSEGGEYIDNYLKLMSVVSLNEGGLNVDDLFKSKTLYANAIRYFQKPDLQEYALAMITLDQGLNNKMFSDEVVTAFADFNTRFPESLYTPFLKPYADRVTDFRTKIKQDFSPEMVFVEGYSDITNLKDLLSRFKGQNLFIDFWFANCGPCREQFKYNEGLKKFLAENNIVMLYVSVDRDEYDSHWKDCIKYYDLKGKHVRTTRELHTDLDNNYGIHSFPTYMVVGQNGDILVSRAKKPETGEALYNQIKDALNLTK